MGIMKATFSLTSLRLLLLRQSLCVSVVVFISAEGEKVKAISRLLDVLINN
jgi:hypothetical protein